jgi:hypothetical protein
MESAPFRDVLRARIPLDARGCEGPHIGENGVVLRLRSQSWWPWEDLLGIAGALRRDGCP